MKNGQLSDRLEAVASMVTPGARLCDVGCDHAYLPIRLCQRKVISNAIGMDIRSGPLSAAREHVRDAGLTDHIELRLSDGLQSLQKEEADTVVITGMGGRLIVRIMDEAPFSPGDIPNWILGPQSDVDIVRGFLETHALHIIDERMVKEDGHRYPIILATPGCGKPLTESEIVFGPCLLASKDPVLREHLLEQKQVLESILAELETASGTRAKARSVEIQSELAIIAEAMQRYEM